VQVNEDGEEIPKSVMCTTDRPLTVKELEEAKDGDDVVEQGVTDDDTEDKADDCDDEDDAPGDDDEDEDVDDDEGDEDADDDDEDSDGNWGAKDNDEPPTTNPHSVKRKSRSAPPPKAVVDVPGTEASRGPAPGRIHMQTGPIQPSLRVIWYRRRICFYPGGPYRCQLPQSAPKPPEVPKVSPKCPTVPLCDPGRL
jgi:hypothetical protein